MKKNYNTPWCEYVVLEGQDVLTASNEGNVIDAGVQGDAANLPSIFF